MKLHILLDIIQLIFPKTCFSCKNVLLSRERILCLKCYLNLPKHIGKKKKHQFNLYVNGQNYKIYCRYKYQKKSAVQKMIYSLKYKNKPHIGYYLGAEL
jgi:predicted amidophosphoribosyltransferase